MPNKLDPEQWAAEVSQLGREWPVEAADIFYRFLSLLALKGVVYRSPVGDPDFWKSPPPKGYIGGQFRGNWDVAVGSPTSDVASGAIDPGGAATVVAGSNVINAAIKGRPYRDIWLLNNLPYAVRLEEGWSHQAPGPGGIVELTAQDLLSGAGMNPNFRVMKNTS